MTLTPVNGARVAKQMALDHSATYVRANKTYGGLLAEYCEDFPLSFALGHLARVNPTMSPSPTPSIDRRRGFMYTPVTFLSSIDIDWEKLDDTTSCAYAWGYDLNSHSRHLYYNNSGVFEEPDVDFWRCVYARHVLGTVPFDTIWLQRNKQQATVYDGFLYTVNNLRRRVPGWSLIKLKRTVFIDCAYSFEFSKQRGTLLSEGFGRTPVLKSNNFVEVFK